MKVWYYNVDGRILTIGGVLVEEFDKDKLIICNNCKAINRGERFCHNCGNDLLENKVQDDNEEKTIEYTNSSNSSNVVAQKFTLIVVINKIIGYICSIVIAIILIIAVNFWIGLVFGLLIAVMTWLSTLLLEAIAEIINLLQDIKNKT